MENELEQKQVGQLIAEISRFGGMDKTQATQLASILMPHIRTYADNQFNAGIEAALEALPEKEIQHPATHPDYNWGQEKTWNDCLDQARSNIERLKK